MQGWINWKQAISDQRPVVQIETISLANNKFALLWGEAQKKLPIVTLRWPNVTLMWTTVALR